MDISSKLNFSIIIPVFNEEKTLFEILNQLQFLKNYCDLEIILVNDGSTDKTKEIINQNRNLYSKSINLEINRGKGKAVIEGLKNCSGEYVLIQDADLEYEPKDIKKFLDKINNYSADLILGSRFIGTERSVLHFWHMIGNKLITILFNLLNNTTYSDIYCCYCLFKKKNVDINKLKSYGWGQHAEILTHAVKNSSKIYEIAVNYNARTYFEGKKIKYYNIFEVIFWIIYTRFKV